jgi:hypothetical protein
MTPSLCPTTPQQRCPSHKKTNPFQRFGCLLRILSKSKRMRNWLFPLPFVENRQRKLKTNPSLKQNISSRFSETTTIYNRFEKHSFFTYLAKQPYKKQVLSRAQALCFEHLDLTKQTNKQMVTQKTSSVHIRRIRQQVLEALRWDAELDHSERDRTLS